MSDFEQTLREGLATLAREAVPDAPAGSNDLAELQWEPKRRRGVTRVLLAAAAVVVIVGVAGLVISRHQSSGRKGVVATVPPQTTTAAPTTTPTTLEPPDASNPAAGTCLSTTGGVVTVTIGSPDNVPNPRCAMVHADQRVGVVNVGATAANITIGRHFMARVPAHGGYTFTDAVGGYLAPGVHYLKFSPLSHAEILVANP
jgi:hypothetical protein